MARVAHRLADPHRRGSGEELRAGLAVNGSELYGRLPLTLTFEVNIRFPGSSCRWRERLGRRDAALEVTSVIGCANRALSATA